jgi:hypothetical protein
VGPILVLVAGCDLEGLHPLVDVDLPLHGVLLVLRQPASHRNVLPTALGSPDSHSTLYGFGDHSANRPEVADQWPNLVGRRADIHLVRERLPCHPALRTFEGLPWKGSYADRDGAVNEMREAGR